MTISWFLKYESFSDVASKIGDNRVVVWQTVEKKREREQICIVGPEVEGGKIATELFNPVRITGGYYVKIESLSSSDEETLVETYRMLYRCSFDGWLRENQERIQCN